MKYNTILTKDFLEKEYVENKKTKFEIVRMIGCTVHTLNKYLKKYNIPNNIRISKKDATLIGIKIGKWLVLEETEADRFSKSRYLCICDCGNKKAVNASSLKRGISLSCGCNIKEKLSKGYKDISGAYWHKIIEGAISRKLDFSITIEYAWDIFIKQSGKCALTGIDLYFSSNNDKAWKQNASFDRIDSSKGYVEGNVQWVLKPINFFKKNLSEKDMLYWANKIVEYNKDRIPLEPEADPSLEKPRRIKYENHKKGIS